MISLCQVQTIVALAKEVGRAILEVYGEEDFGISLKFGQSPVTRADRVAHHLILSGLQALTPDLPVLSEESKTIPYPQRQHWKAYWLVDPLDGTKEFIQTVREEAPLVEIQSAIESVLARMSSDALYFSYVLERVPSLLPHENGMLTRRALLHILVPRIFFPEKLNLGSDSWLVK